MGTKPVFLSETGLKPKKLLVEEIHTFFTTGQ